MKKYLLDIDFIVQIGIKLKIKNKKTWTHKKNKKF